MAETPQIQDTQPILDAIKPADKSEGYDEFARTLGSLSKVTANKAEEIETDKSSAMLTNSIANAEQIKSSSQARMLESPDNANKIAEQTTQALEMVKKASFVNSKDRTQLNAYISTTDSAVNLKATETSVRQSQRGAAFTHYANWPDELKAYEQTVKTGDPKQVQAMHDAMVNTLRGLVSMGALTPEQAGNGIKGMANAVDIAQDHFAMYGNPNATAKDFHTVTSNPLNPTSNTPGNPINVTTGWTTDYYSSDRSFQGVMADVADRKLPNPMVFDSLPSAQRQHAILAMQGTQQADGIINSGETHDAIAREYQDLSNKNRVLSYRDQAKRNALGTYLNNIKNGNMLSLMANDPQGNGILQNFNQSNAAINNIATFSPEQRAAALNQNKDHFTNQAVSWAQARNIPSESIQPISSADVATTASSFVLGGHPENALVVMSHYSKQNQAYVANSQKEPGQRIILQAISYAPNDISPEDKLDLIAANQKGRKFLSQEKGKLEGAPKDSELLTRVYANLVDSMKTIQRNYDPQQAQTLTKAMVDSTLNLARYKAEKQSNSNMQAKGINTDVFDTQWHKYVDDASSIYMKAFQSQSGTNYIVNPQQLLQPLTNTDLDALASYAINKGYERLKGNRSDAEVMSAIERNPLTMSISPTNQLEAIDGNGIAYFSEPLTGNTIALAHKINRDRKNAAANVVANANMNIGNPNLNIGGNNNVNAQ